MKPHGFVAAFKKVTFSVIAPCLMFPAYGVLTGFIKEEALLNGLSKILQQFDAFECGPLDDVTRIGES